MTVVDQTKLTGLAGKGAALNEATETLRAALGHLEEFLRRLNLGVPGMVPLQDGRWTWTFGKRTDKTWGFGFRTGDGPRDIASLADASAPILAAAGAKSADLVENMIKTVEGQRMQVDLAVKKLDEVLAAFREAGIQ